MQKLPTSQRFQKFHADNPKVYEYFKMFAFQAINAGWKHIGSKSIIEQIRWHISIETRSFDGFKINNIYTPYYSRLFVTEYPQYIDIFSFKTLKEAA